MAFADRLGQRVRKLEQGYAEGQVLRCPQCAWVAELIPDEVYEEQLRLEPIRPDAIQLLVRAVMVGVEQAVRSGRRVVIGDVELLPEQEPVSGWERNAPRPDWLHESVGRQVREADAVAEPMRATR